MLTVSAPGKVHLIGEHAVVYGEPAILASVGLRTTVRFSPSEDGTIRYRDLFGSDFSCSVEDVIGTAREARDLWESCFRGGDFSRLFSRMKEGKYGNFKKAVIGTVMIESGMDGGLSAEMSSDIPPGAGLGSSASMACCFAAGVPAVLGKRLQRGEVNRIALEMEKLVHGSPSGGDNAACCYGGLIWFEKGKPFPLEKEAPFPLENFVFVYSRKPEKTTGELVQGVRMLPPEVRNPSVGRIGSATREMRSALGSGNFSRIRDLMNSAQQELKRLGVSVHEIDRIHEKVRSIGGAAKGCGSLGGGIVLCYHEDKERLLSLLREMGLEPFEAALGVEGVRVTP